MEQAETRGKGHPNSNGLHLRKGPGNGRYCPNDRIRKWDQYGKDENTAERAGIGRKKKEAKTNKKQGGGGFAGSNPSLPQEGTTAVGERYLGRLRKPGTTGGRAVYGQKDAQSPHRTRSSKIGSRAIKVTRGQRRIEAGIPRGESELPLFGPGEFEAFPVFTNEPFARGGRPSRRQV